MVDLSKIAFRHSDSLVGIGLGDMDEDRISVGVEFDVEVSFKQIVLFVSYDDFFELKSEIGKLGFYLC